MFKRCYLPLALACLGLTAHTHAQTPSSVVETSNAALRAAIEQQRIAGTVTLVADKDKVLALTAVGEADLVSHAPMRLDALFWIASQSKPITATAFMMLVDEGKVSVDDPVEKYLPEFKDVRVVVEKDATHTLLRPPARPVTIRDLLSHRSGLPFSTNVEQPTLDALPLRTAVASYAMVPLATEPGAKFQYANAGINTVGRLIEVISGQPFEDFLRTRLFEPLGMHDTTFWPSEEQVARLAKSYQLKPPGNTLEEVPITQLHSPLGDRAHRYPMPAGGLFSTAEDLGRFCRMILHGGTLDGHRYVSEAAVRQMGTNQTAPEDQGGYGLGWSVHPHTMGHGGAYSTDMDVYFDRNLVTVFMVQQSDTENVVGAARDKFQQATLQLYGSTPP